MWMHWDSKNLGRSKFWEKYKTSPLMSVKNLIRSYLTETCLVHYLIFEDKNEEGWKSMQEFIFRGDSKTTWTRFWPFLTTYLPQRGQKDAFFDHLPTSSCPCSFWMTPSLATCDHESEEVEILNLSLFLCVKYACVRMTLSFWCFLNLINQN